MSVIPAVALSIDGTAGDDYLVGTSEGDLIRAGAGDDVVLAKAGNDTVAGGIGHDVLRLGPGRDWATTGRGDDTVYGGGGEDYVELRWGGDVAVTRRGGDYVDCFTPGSCQVRTGPGPDEADAFGEVTADLRGGPGADWLSYWANARIFGHQVGSCPRTGACRPDVIIRGGRGQDVLVVEFGNRVEMAGHFTVVGGAGEDSIDVSGYTQVRAGRGDDGITVWGPATVVDCGPGNDDVEVYHWAHPRPTPMPQTVHCETVEWFSLDDDG